MVDIEIVYFKKYKHTAKNKGKSSGYRVITYYIDESEKVFLVYIYDKSMTIMV